MVACVAATGTVFGVTTPAHAAVWQVVDGFEGDPSSRWSCWHTEEHWANRCTFFGRDANLPAVLNPRTGEKMGAVFVATGWSDIGRAVSLSPFQSGRTLRCGAAVHVLPPRTNDKVIGQVEVIDVATWTYVSITPFTLTSADFRKWRQITTSTWIPPRKDVFIRIGLIADDSPGVKEAHLDDVTVQCQYF